MTSGLETYSIINVKPQEDFFRQIDVGFKTKVAATVNAVVLCGDEYLSGFKLATEAHGGLECRIVARLNHT